MEETAVKRLLAEQRRYYGARAPEYDDWWFRRGRYAVDDEAARGWFADVFTWEPPRAFDACVFGFWLSHVPSSRFAAFWSLVGRGLKPDGRVFLVDNAHLGDPRHLVSAGGEVARRSVSDGREFDIVKRFWAPAELEREVAALGWQLTAGATTNGHFIFALGSGSTR